MSGWGRAGGWARAWDGCGGMRVHPRAPGSCGVPRAHRQCHCRPLREPPPPDTTLVHLPHHACTPPPPQDGVRPVSTAPVHSRGHASLSEYDIDLGDGKEHQIRIVFEPSRFATVRAGTSTRRARAWLCAYRATAACLWTPPARSQLPRFPCKQLRRRAHRLGSTVLQARVHHPLAHSGLCSALGSSPLTSPSTLARPSRAGLCHPAPSLPLACAEVGGTLCDE